jgi:hypothetical protein
LAAIVVEQRSFKVKLAVLLLASGALVSGLIAALCGLIAALYWYRSTKVPLETTTPDAKGFDTAAFGLAAGAYQAYQAVAALNKKAALWTAVAAIFGAAATIFGAASAVLGVWNSNFDTTQFPDGSAISTVCRGKPF